MKKLYMIVVAMIFGFTTNAQLTHPEGVNTNETPLFSSTKAPGDSCGAYYNNYVGLAKTSLLYFEPMRTGNASETNQYGGRAMRYNAPQPIEISGIEFFAFETNSTLDSIMAITILHDYDAVNDTVGAELARDTVYVKHQAFSAFLPNISVKSTFETPVTVTNDYMLTVLTLTDDSLKIITNSAPDNDGAAEGLSYLYYNNPAGIVASYAGYYNNYALYGASYDLDYLINPRVKYDLHDGFLLSNDTVCPGDINAACVNYTQLPIYGDPHYNQYSSTQAQHILWLWGDGFQNTDLLTACHTYDNPGSYNLTLHDTLRRWMTGTPFCVSAAVESVVALDSVYAGINFTGAASTFNFTNTSTNADSVWWDFGDTTAGTSMNNPTHVYDSLGTYTVTLIAYNDCFSDTTTVTVTADDVGLPNLGMDFGIYPNPANTEVNINGLVPGSSIEVLNILGEVVYRASITQSTEQLSVAEFSAGTYFIRVTTDYNQKTKKMLIRH